MFLYIARFATVLSRAGVPLTGENALQRYDKWGMNRIRESALAGRRGLHQITFLRMGHLMFDHWDSFKTLVEELSELEAADE